MALKAVQVSRCWLRPGGDSGEREESRSGCVLGTELTGRGGRLDVAGGRGEEIKDDSVVSGSVTRPMIAPLTEAGMAREDPAACRGGETKSVGCAAFQTSGGNVK